MSAERVHLEKERKSSPWKETHRGLVFPWNCDNYGHMNVRFYWDHFDDSAFQTWTTFGCTTLLHETGIHAVTGRNTISYLGEMTAGTLFVITAAVTRIGNRSVTFTHRMHNTETGELCATMIGTEVMFDPDTRGSAEIPPKLRERLNDLLIETEDRSHPDQSGARDARVDTPGEWHEVHRGLVFPWRCDHFGHLNARWYGHHFDDGGFHLFSMAGVDVAGLQAQNVAPGYATKRSDLHP